MQNKSQWSLLIIKGTLEYSFKYFVCCMLCLNALYFVYTRQETKALLLNRTTSVAGYSYLNCIGIWQRLCMFLFYGEWMASLKAIMFTVFLLVYQWLNRWQYFLYEVIDVFICHAVAWDVQRGFSRQGICSFIAEYSVCSFLNLLGMVIAFGNSKNWVKERKH